MKYSEIIAEVKELYPNEYNDSQYIKWILELENTIAVQKGTGVKRNIDLEKEATVGVPYDRMYIDYLLAKVSLNQHDDENYARHMNVFKMNYKDWEAFDIRTTPGKKHQFKGWI